MIVRKAFKYCLYPNRVQEESLTVQFGQARYIYNWGLSQNQDRYPGYCHLAKCLPKLKWPKKIVFLPKKKPASARTIL